MLSAWRRRACATGYAGTMVFTCMIATSLNAATRLAVFVCPASKRADFLRLASKRGDSLRPGSRRGVSLRPASTQVGPTYPGGANLRYVQ